MTHRITVLLAACLAVASVLPAFSDPTPYVATQESQLERADQLEKEGRFAEAVGIYDALVREGAGRDQRWMGYLLFRLACAQEQLGDRLSAMESASAATQLDPAEPSYKAFHSTLVAKQTGRPRARLYRARRDQGSAKRLVQTSGILHVFVRGRNTEAWEAEDLATTRSEIEEADRWLEGHAASQGLRLRFEHRYATLPAEPFWRTIDVPEPYATDSYRRAWLQAVLLRFHASSWSAVFDRLFEGMDVDQRAIVFHTSQRDVSLAVFGPHWRPGTDLESIVVSSEASEWKRPYAAVGYTHQLLHLYGADDLFNKVQESATPESDVMNFGAHRLEECQLSSLTRYAIGWTDQPPALSQLRLDELRTPRKKGIKG